MRFLFLSIILLRYLSGYCQSNFDSQILNLIKDIPNDFRTYQGAGNEVTTGTMEYKSSLVIEGTQENVIYVFFDSAVNKSGSYYLATIDSTSKTKPKKLLKVWVNKIESLPGTKIKMENYSVNMGTLGLATGTRCKGPNFKINIYYQKNPLTQLYVLYMAIGADK
ncbi:MAG: hypothetical protein ACJ75B_22470 [Flavisolibacter sp.]